MYFFVYVKKATTLFIHFPIDLKRRKSVQFVERCLSNLCDLCCKYIPYFADSEKAWAFKQRRSLEVSTLQQSFTPDRSLEVLVFYCALYDYRESSVWCFYRINSLDTSNECPQYPQGPFNVYDICCECGWRYLVPTVVLTMNQPTFSAFKKHLYDCKYLQSTAHFNQFKKMYSALHQNILSRL